MKLLNLKNFKDLEISRKSRSKRRGLILVMLVLVCLAVVSLGVFGADKSGEGEWADINGAGAEEVDASIEIEPIVVDLGYTPEKTPARHKDIDDVWLKIGKVLGIDKAKEKKVYDPFDDGWFDFDGVYMAGAAGEYKWPIRENIILTSCFGKRALAISPCTDGIDVGGIEGVTPVYAISEGIVKDVKTGCVKGDRGCGGGYGNYVLIKHNDGKLSRYSHLSGVSVTEGKAVTTNTLVGNVGNTGLSTGAHLDLKIYLNEDNVGGDQGVNPICYLEKRDIIVKGNNCPADPWSYCFGNNLVKSAETQCNE